MNVASIVTAALTSTAVILFLGVLRSIGEVIDWCKSDRDWVTLVTYILAVLLFLWMYLLVGYYALVSWNLVLFGGVS